MAITVTHAKVSTKSDGSDPTEILPSDWNALHQILGYTGSEQELLEYDVSPTTSIAANGSYNNVTITPNVGLIGYLNAIYANIPAVSGASSGSHTLVIMAGTNSNLAILYITAPYNTPIQVAGLSVTSGTPRPTTDTSIVNALTKFAFDNNLPLNVRYTNNTNAAQTNARTYNIQYILNPETSF